MSPNQRLARFVGELKAGGCLLLAILAMTPCSAAPAPAQESAAPENLPVVKVYSCPVGEAEATAALLRGEFQGVPGIRIVAEPRSGQIVVQAAPEVQDRVARRLAAISQGARAAPARPSPATGSPAAGFDPYAPKAVSLTLVKTNTRQLEEGLLALFGKRLGALPSAELGGRSVQLALPGGKTLRLDMQAQTGRVMVQGPAANVDAAARLIQALDAPEPTADRSVRLVSLQQATPATMRRMVEALQASGLQRPAHGPLVAMLFQQPEDGRPDRPAPEVPAPKEGTGAAPKEGTGPAPKDGAAAAPGTAGAKPAEGPGLIGSVQAELLDGLDVIILRGHRRDVEEVMKIVQQIERLSALTEPVIEVLPLRYVDSQALSELIIPLYDQIYLARRGDVSITALIKPNALLLVGRRENVKLVVDLVKKLDRPVSPDTEFQVFRLRHAAVANAQMTLLEFFAMRLGLGTRVRVTADYRSNALIVQASPRDMAEVAELIAKIDTPFPDAVNEIRLFKLENALADEMAYILQSAITGQAVARAPGVPGMPAAPGVPGAMPGAAGAAAGQRSAMLRFITVDKKGQRRLNSGILTDVRITPDARTNSLLVQAPPESMELIETLIRQIDTLPPAEAQIKVFTIVNGDAASLTDMLQMLFSRQMTPGQAVLQAIQGSVTQGESMLIPLRFAVDVRTNSIIASGSVSDLQVVEAILLRLDESDVRRRKNVVYRLKNAPALDVANAINQFLQTERQVQLIAPGLITAYELIEREVVVVPEPISNSLIVSATPRFFDEVKRIVEELDQRPPMVMIQVLIGEVSLNNTDEFGVELGIQDSILFDRSLLGNITTVTRTTFNELGQPTSENQEIASATYTPGFAFNNNPLGQSSGAGTSSRVGTQGISHFGLGRLNNELGYGGLVFSASSEAVSVMIRALKECRRLEVLSRPQVMTLDNQPAFIQVGQRVPRITGTSVNQTAQVNSITLENVGLILGVTPRISPDGLVVMQIDAEKSEVGPEAEGIPVSISATGQVVRSPRINTTMAQTTVSAVSGQTVVLGGLITKSKSEFHRKVPFLGDIPIAGVLFRYDQVIGKRTELLIIMTPHIVRSEADAEAIKRIESARMHWCLSDVLAVHGKGHLTGDGGVIDDSGTVVVYPDMDPHAQGFKLAPNGAPSGAELVPVPEGAPGRPPAKQRPNGAAPPSKPLLPLEEPPAEPTLGPPAGAGPKAAQPPDGAELRLRPADQAQRWTPQQTDGGRQAVAAQAGWPAAPPAAAANPVVPARYQAPPGGPPWSWAPPPAGPPNQPPPSATQPVAAPPPQAAPWYR